MDVQQFCRFLCVSQMKNISLERIQEIRGMPGIIIHDGRNDRREVVALWHLIDARRQDGGQIIILIVIDPVFLTGPAAQF